MSKHLIKDVQHHGSSVVITPAEGSHKAYMTSNWYSASDVSILVVLRDTKKAHSFLDELSTGVSCRNRLFR